MKIKLVLLLLWSMSALQMSAQLNPKPGYIITHEQDTVHGTIDYLSDTKNAMACSFRGDGESLFHSYGPADIDGYRFEDDGAYYVSRTFPVDGVEKSFFAEFLLQGGVSLYHYRSERGYDYYYVVDEYGKVAEIKNSQTFLSADDGQNRNLKREALKSAGQLLARSPKAVERLWKADINSSNLTSIIRDFNKEFCTSYGECVQFQYDARLTKSVEVRLRLFAGLDFDQMRLKSPSKLTGDDLSFDASAPVFGIGAEFMLPRMSDKLTFAASVSFAPSFSASTMKTANPYTEDHEFYDKFKAAHTARLKYSRLRLDLGANYAFLSRARVTPFVSAGLSLQKVSGLEADNLTEYEVKSDMKSIHQLGFGGYIGAGAEFRIWHHRLRLTGEYSYVSFMGFDAVCSSFGARLGFIF